MVKVLAFYSNNPSSNPADYLNNFLNEEAGFGPHLKKNSLKAKIEGAPSAQRLKPSPLKLGPPSDMGWIPVVQLIFLFSGIKWRDKNGTRNDKMNGIAIPKVNIIKVNLVKLAALIKRRPSCC